VQNAPCLGCHRGGERLHWQGSEHDAGHVACADCHVLHTGHDPMLERDLRPETWRRPQAEACFRCHPQQRAMMHRPSAHPIKEGLVRCSDCHQPHGSATPALLRGYSLNETCYRCHAEKRGPFLWEHPPAREDCSHCHEPHGSVHVALLKRRPPWLCQECHMAPQHPSGVYTAAGLPGPSPDDRLLVKACVNCHSEVHGSNHPSGPRFTR
jgi:DmsE family decaheme c-type cytochrome